MGQNKSKQGRGGLGPTYDGGKRMGNKPYLGNTLDRYNNGGGPPRGVGGARPMSGATSRPSPSRGGYNSGGSGYTSYSNYKTGKSNGQPKYSGYSSSARQGGLGGALPLDPADTREQSNQMPSTGSKYGSAKRAGGGYSNQSYAQRQLTGARPNKPPNSLPSYTSNKFKNSNSKNSNAYSRSSAYSSKPSRPQATGNSYKGSSYSRTNATSSKYKKPSTGASKAGKTSNKYGSGYAGAARPKPSKQYGKSNYSGQPRAASSSTKSSAYASDRQPSKSKYATGGSKWQPSAQPVINEDQTLAIPEKDDPPRSKHGFAMDKKMTIEDFVFLKVVGKGSFGKVMQVRYKKDGKIYAMKVLKKKALVKRKQVIHTRTERRVVAAVNNPFIVSLRYAFQTPAKLYMILDFFNGGELFFHLKKEGRFSERRAKFYGAEITSALGALHALNIVYRDLKPENILLDQDGHIKITDFGLSKDSIEADELTHTFCGTPEYLAPEVLQQQGHGKAVDWWSFGTLLYEMMTGLPPFYNQNLNIMYEKILHAQIKMPTYLSKESRSLFRGLLERNPSKRLASGPGDADEIKVHPYFREIDWPKLESRGVKPPFSPPVANERQTHMFEPEFTDLTPKDTPVVNSSSMLKAEGAFPGFTYDHSKDTSAFSEES